MKLRNAMDSAASQVKNSNGFDGNLLEEDAEELTAFCNSNEISSLSISLAEVLVCMERHNQQKTPNVRATAIYNALLRLEKAANNTSSWELYGQDFDGPLFDFTTLEVDAIEEQMSKYIVDILEENTDETLFFPLDDFYSSDIIVKWRILQKIATIRLFAKPVSTVYKNILKKLLKERLKKEVSLWLKKEIEKLKLSHYHTVHKDAEILTKILKDLRHHINMVMDVTLTETLFEETECNYLDIFSETVDNIIFPVCERVMEMMYQYQAQHRNFHVNMRDSCALSHALYLQLKRLACLLTIQDNTEKHLMIQDYSGIFSQFFMNLLHVMKMECHNRIHRAVQAEINDREFPFQEKILSSSVIVLNCICTVIDEWKHLEIENEEQRIAFLVKITDIVCDGVKIFAESSDLRVRSMIFSTDDSEALKQVCVIANSIEHILEYLSELPKQMLGSEILEDDSSDSNTSVKEQVLRTLEHIHGSMNETSTKIITQLLKLVASDILQNVEKFLVSWLQPQMTNQAFKSFFEDLKEILKIFEEILKDSLFPRLLTSLWSFLIPSIQRGFQEGQTPEYARSVKENVLRIRNYFWHNNMKDIDSHRPSLQKLMDILDRHLKTTEELMLDYYVQIAEAIVSPIEYLGHVAFQAGYKTSGDEMVDIHINVQKGQKLPARKLEMSQLTVKVELCPSTLFPSCAPLKSSPITEDLDNPVFNEYIQFSNLPSNVMNIKGAAVQVLVYNQDYSYSTEAILLLNQVQNMCGIVSLEFLPVYLMPLRKFDMSHISYQVLKQRSRWDKNAKQFISKRSKLSKNQRKLFSCFSGRDLMCNFARNS